MVLSLFLLISVFVFAACSYENYDPFPNEKEVNLIEKYDLTINTYFHGDQPRVFISHPLSNVDLVIEMSVRMQPFCTCSTTIKEFFEIEAEQPQVTNNLYWRTFIPESELWFYDGYQPATWVSIKILGEKQTLYFERDSYHSYYLYEEVDLVEKYGLSFEVGIWNDYMPSINPSQRSVHYVQFTTTSEDLTNVEMSVEILTTTKRFVRIFTDIYSGETTPWGAYDFRAIEDFRLDDGEAYTMYITIGIAYERQIIELAGTVGVTH